MTRDTATHDEPHETDTQSDALRDPLSLFDVKGKTAIVTGATGGFGRGVSLALGSLGCNLVLASGSGNELEEVTDEVLQTGADVRALQRRPTTLDDAQAMVDTAVEAFGGADMLVVGSGLNKPGFIHEQSYEEWQEVMDANVRGPWLMCKAFGTYLIEHGRPGKVLLVSSVRGRHGNISGYSAYCTSKGATDALVRVLAAEWGKHQITVNAIAPTVFRSKLTAWMYGDDELGRATRERSLSRIPLGRLAEVEDLIGMVLYLLSPASDFVTGQVVYIDGGYTAA